MAKNYTLWRAGHKIKVEKEPEYFTAIIPQAKMVQEISFRSEVAKMKRVFHNVYKIKANEGGCDDLMNHLRQNYQSKCVFHHAYNPSGDQSTRYYITDLVVVSFKKGTTNSKIEGIMRKHGIHYLKQYKNQALTFLFKVTSSAGKNPVKVCNDLASLKEVRFAEPNLVNRFDHFHTPKDHLFQNQWHLKSTKGIELVSNADIDATKAWKITRGSRDIVVAVIDDGFDLDHPDLNGAGKVVHPKDFVDGDNNPFPIASHDDYHGTPCAGVAIGEENGEGIVGIAPESSFMPIRFDLSADDNMLWEIFDYVGNRADVISCSWGPVPVYAPLSSLLEKKFTELSKTGGPRGKGCVIVFAAGNFNAPIKDPKNKSFKWLHPNGTIKNTTYSILNGNAAHPDIITVAASTSQNKKAAYSNWGKEISVCSPSDNWHPTDPQAYMPGRGIWTTDNESLGLGFTDNSRYTGYFGGTSSATPLVAGVAALIFAANPDLTGKEVRKIIKESTDKIEDKNADVVLKNKKGTYDSKGHSEWFGTGKINAAKAVEKAKSLIKKPKKEPKPSPKQKEETTSTITSTAKSTGGDVFIVSALVNPKGKEYGAESVSLLNVSNNVIDLSGWTLSDKRNRKLNIEGISLNPGAFITITLKKVQLSNSGGSILLSNEKGMEMHKVNYTKKDVSKDGWTVRF